MRKLMLSFFTLLLFAAATTTTATAQAATPKKLAVLVVGMDDWMLGDVLAHLVGEELSRGSSYDVVTRRNDVQNKLESLRRGNDRLDDALLRAWATGQAINTLCVVTTTPGLNFSLRLLDVSSGDVQCNGSRVEPSAISLKQLAWSLAGGIGNGCSPSGSSYTESQIGMEMVYVEGGEFTMGCVSGRDDRNGHICDNNEKPAHTVTVGNFCIGKYEVTQAQWEAVMVSTVYSQGSKAGYGSTHGVGDNYPMYYVSWNDAQTFCAVLSYRTGKHYRLPTEEEWEYAARGGKSSLGYVYSGGNSIDSVAWHSGNSGTNGGSSSTQSHIVGTTKSQGNELGIYDMSGNVSEWCYNNWRSNYSAEESGPHRVIRGGSWYSDAWSCRVAYRTLGDGEYGPNYRHYSVGFRGV
jgi:formylglycine-generating enzyme required for sulfatase activity